MSKFLYSVKDDVTGKYADPFVADNDRDAARKLIPQFQKIPSYLRSDLSLFCVSEWSDSEELPVLLNKGFNVHVVDVNVPEEVKA